MIILKEKTEVFDVVRSLEFSNKIVHHGIITHTGFHRIPLGENRKPVIVNIVFFCDENCGIAILTEDENGNYKDFIFDPCLKTFKSNTLPNKHIDWTKQGFAETPAPDMGKICCSGCWDENSYFLGENGESNEKTIKSDISTLSEQVGKMINEIEMKEPAAAKALELVIKHIHGTYSDKYAKGQDIIDTKKMLYNKEHGHFLNIYQVNRYLQRYLTTGSPKSYLLKDIEKTIHYLVFEITRRILINDIDEIEPKH